MPKYTMSDGRTFTSYAPNCALNQYLQQKYKVSDSHVYRLFLQKNAEKLMKELQDCSSVGNCDVCPICNAALEYKPTGGDQ